MKIEGIKDVVENHLCSGCGACAYMAPDAITMEDVENEGRRPSINPEKEVSAAALKVCPGIGLAHPVETPEDPYIPELRSAWGPILEVWEGHATDPEIRFAGSSGGAITALALYCLEAGGMEHVVHTAARTDVPYLNETVISRMRADLVSATGSRYAPASPCDGLKSIEAAGAPCVFIGKPCDVAAAQLARKLRPRLDKNLGITIGFFCAGTPSTRGTLEMLKSMGVENADSLISLRYRGNGWPGKATAKFRRKCGAEDVHDLSYEESWGEILSNHQQWRCKLCADHTSEFADIAVGDPWYRIIESGEPGRSLIMARTERGQKLILAAAEAGYLQITAASPSILPASQPNLLRTRGALWGRILGCRIMRAPAPVYTHMPLFPHWWCLLTWREKTRSVIGACKRVMSHRVATLRRDRGARDKDKHG